MAAMTSFASTFVLVIHTLIAIALCGVILLQRSEGGGLGIGGGNAGGLMSARGAADLLSRSTTILAALFITTSIILAVLAASSNKARPIDTSLATPGVSAPAKPAPAAPGLQIVPPAAPTPAPTDSVPVAN